MKQLGNVYVSDGTFGDVLSHFGILGMKWGVRRYQDTDGRLTADGRERYRTLKTAKRASQLDKGEGPFLSKQTKKELKAEALAVQKETAEARKRAKELQSTTLQTEYSDLNGYGNEFSSVAVFEGNLRKNVKGTAGPDTTIRYKEYGDDILQRLPEVQKTVDDVVRMFVQNDSRFRKAFAKDIAERGWPTDKLDASTWVCDHIDIGETDYPFVEFSYDDHNQLGGHYLTLVTDRNGKLYTHSFIVDD